jgi:hypothetical protein
MHAEHGQPVSSSEVLMFLGDAPERRMRMSDIADRVLLSRSGLTRLADRLCQFAYVTRYAAENDAAAYTPISPALAPRNSKPHAAHTTKASASSSSTTAPRPTRSSWPTSGPGSDSRYRPPAANAQGSADARLTLSH